MDEKFPLSDLAMLTDTLDNCNKVAGEDLYRWELISVDGNSVESAEGIMVNAEKSAGSKYKIDPDQYLSIVLSGVACAKNRDSICHDWIRKRSAAQKKVCGIGRGVFRLAEIGLLQGRQSATHWELIQKIVELHPDTEPVVNLFILDGNVYTCSGGMATLDMMCNLVRKRLGEAMTLETCARLNISNIRLSSDTQTIITKNVVTDERVRSILRLMDKNIAESLSIYGLLKGTNLSRRQIERLFRECIGYSPMQYYRRLRLRRALSLVKISNQAIQKIASSCGFMSASHFSRCFRAEFGMTPEAARAQERERASALNLSGFAQQSDGKKHSGRGQSTQKSRGRCRQFSNRMRYEDRVGY